MVVGKPIYLFFGSLGLLMMACKEPPAPLATADFYVDGNECTAPCDVQFFDQSINAVQWRWEFGNGTSSSLSDDTTTYLESAMYKVQLTVWNSDNIADSISKTITIN